MKYFFAAQQHKGSFLIPVHEFIPNGLFDEENQCRNSEQWPFYATDPICPVWSPEVKGMILEACFVPQCHPNRELDTEHDSKSIVVKLILMYERTEALK